MDTTVVARPHATTPTDVQSRVLTTCAPPPWYPSRLTARGMALSTGPLALSLEDPICTIVISAAEGSGRITENDS
jgi:hypothetical protein